jgi:hypothetical protein
MSDGGWKTSGPSSAGPVDRARGWLDRVPGYRGYREKEDRRDADRRVRDQIAADLTARAERVEGVARSLANQRRLAEIAPVDELARSIRHLIDRIRTASYGYGGLFSDRDVDEAAIDQLNRFDESLLAGVATMDPTIAALEQALAGSGDLTGPAAAATGRVRSLHDRLDLRGQVIETGRPAPRERVAAVLAAEQVETPPNAYNLAPRDAIAVMGDNFIVDARIDVVADNDGFRLFRVGGGEPERWLFVPRASDGEFALFEKYGDAPPAERPVVDGVALAETKRGRGDGELASGERASGRRAVTFSLFTSASDNAKRALLLDWSGERQLFAGSVVHPDDVDIFGGGAGKGA